VRDPRRQAIEAQHQSRRSISIIDDLPAAYAAWHSRENTFRPRRRDRSNRIELFRDHASA
jgi:hypothetical protein